jgi:hypothetical protein
MQISGETGYNNLQYAEFPELVTAGSVDVRSTALAGHPCVHH